MFSSFARGLVSRISTRLFPRILQRGVATIGHSAIRPNLLAVAKIPQSSPLFHGSNILSKIITSVSCTNVRSYQSNKDSYRILVRMHKLGPHIKKRKKKRPLDGACQLKGVVLRTLIKKPKKPNSANRKCVLVRLSNGKEKVAYVPGIGHNLQEHNVVLCEVGRLRDTPGVRIRCIRGKYDLPHVVKQKAT